MKRLEEIITLLEKAQIIVRKNDGFELSEKQFKKALGGREGAVETNAILQQEQEARLSRKQHQNQLKFALIGMFLLIGTVGLTQVLAKKNKIEEQIAKQQSMIDQTYFYKGNYAPCVQKDSSGHFKYGFMDRTGIVRIPYRFDEVQGFDKNGYARVKVGQEIFFIDTIGHRFDTLEPALSPSKQKPERSLKEEKTKEGTKKIELQKETKKTFKIVGTKKAAVTPIQKLLDGFVQVAEEERVEFKMKLEKSDNKNKLIVLMIGQQENDLLTFPKGAQITFIAGFEQLICTFDSKLGHLTVAGQPAYISSFIIKDKDLLWMQKNVISQLILQHGKQKARKAFKVSRANQTVWNRYLKAYTS